LPFNAHIKHVALAPKRVRELMGKAAELCRAGVASKCRHGCPECERVLEMIDLLDGVNSNVYRASEFGAKLADGEPFLQRVMEDRKIYLVGGEDDLRQPSAHRKAQGTRRR
jgi:hypothetical protein